MFCIHIQYSVYILNEQHILQYGAQQKVGIKGVDFTIPYYICGYIGFVLKGVAVIPPPTLSVAVVPAVFCLSLCPCPGRN